MAEAKKSISSPIDHSAAWDWEKSHVSQAYIDPAPDGSLSDSPVSINDIIESGTVLIAAGPADLDAASQDDLGVRIAPIGLVETAQISMSKPLSRIFEIGSKLSYIIPGRVVGGIGLSRVFFDGPSLLKAIYRGEVKADAADTQSKFVKFVSNKYKDSQGNEAYQKFDNIGSGNLAINLASSFFNQPCGLAFYFRDQQNDAVASIYFEGCHVSTHNIGISANMNVLTEAINMEFIRCRPIVTQATSGTIIRGVDTADINIVSEPSNPIPTT
jgi:hypothetical protein